MPCDPMVSEACGVYGVHTSCKGLVGVRDDPANRSVPDMRLANCACKCHSPGPPVAALKPDDIRPSHYGGADNPHEVKKCLAVWGLVHNAYRWNAVKYIARAGRKDPAQEITDLEKAREYLAWEIERLKAGK